jgi:preprotein translocase subunit SecA
MAQRDPLVEYQREGFLLFQAMTEAIKEESVGYLFQLEVQVQPPAEGDAAEQTEEAQPAFVAKGLEVQESRSALQYSAPSVDGEAGLNGVEVREEVPDTGSSEPTEANPFPGASLNAPCPCGSGKKYKRCHGAARRGAGAAS